MLGAICAGIVGILVLVRGNAIIALLLAVEPSPCRSVFSRAAPGGLALRGEHGRELKR